uniref:VPS9 domain-containing protein n=1 Tax=Rhodnius prolixus TaxID=13249 RepID=T1I0D4_RHOPR
MLEATLRKEIVRNLHSAIDSEMLNDDNAYCYYIKSLALVSDVLKTDVNNPTLSHKDKWNLIEFAKQSVERLVFIVKKGQNSSDNIVTRDETPSAPPENLVNEQSFITLCQNSCEDEMIMSRYQKRLGMATSAMEKQNLELELARQLVEKAAITRNRLMQATAWAMQTAHKKFKIQEKLQNGKLVESDFKKQQLYALSLQFNQSNSWLNQLASDLALYPNHEKIVRELLDNILTDNSQPVKATINHMQEKVNTILNKSLSNPDADPKEHALIFEEVSNTIKDDINIIQDVVKALFEPLNSEKNVSITSEVVHHVYFAPLKQNIITLIRYSLKDIEKQLVNRIKEGFEEGINFRLTECCKEAITKLHYLTTLHNPYDMLDCTVHIIKLLAATKFEQKHCTSVGADDLLPRLCQVVVSSSLPSICAEATFMETFMPAARALGEDGYAVTMLQSAIAHLANTTV